MEQTLIAIRFVHFSAVLLAFGVLFFRGFGLKTVLKNNQQKTCHPGNAAGVIRDPIASLQYDLLNITAWLSGISFISALAWLMLEAGLMGGAGWGGLFNLDALQSVLSDTGFGHVWSWRLLCGALLWINCLFKLHIRTPDSLQQENIGCSRFKNWFFKLKPSCPRRRASTLLFLATKNVDPLSLKKHFLTASAAAFLASLAFTGHAVMGDGVAGVLHRLNHAIHLLMGGLWLGALLSLLFILWKQKHEWSAPLIQDAFCVFSSIGMWVVMILVLSGSINLWFMIQQGVGSLSSTYCLVLGIKILLVAGMILCAAINRYVLMPALRLAATQGKLLQLVVVENALGLMVLVAVSALGTLSPF